MGRILGIDYGRRRLGFAVSDATGTVATPLDTVHVASVAEALDLACGVARSKRVERVVVGLPRNMDGTCGPMAREAQAFAERLAGMLGIPVVMWDERLSSALVERMLVEADVSRSRRREVRDKLAAQVILQGFMDAEQGRKERENGSAADPAR